VEDNYGNSDIDTVQVVVSMPQDLTVRHFKAYYSNPYKRVPLKVIVRPVIEYMPGLERVVQNQWTVGTDFVASNRNMLALTFNGPGDYNINFEGITNYGRSLLGGFSVTVNPNQLPQCTMEYQDYPTYGYTKFTPSCIDPDGRVRSYFWNFGNGETSKTRTGYAHYNQSGTYNVRLTVKDDSGDEASIQWDVVVER
jgi:PKD repeat protein